MRVLVIGGGIGGLTAAVALKRAGFDAHVYEQMHELREVGAGLVLGSNAVRVLHGLGFAAQLRRVGMIGLPGYRMDWQTGAFVDSQNAGGHAIQRRFGLPSYIVHRADAHDAVRSGLADDDITLNARCVRVEQDERQVTAHFADGISVSGDVLIGADGAESVVREHVTGPNVPIGQSKHAWRGLAPGEVGHKLGMEARQYSHRADGKFFLAYFVANQRYVNWVGIMNPKEEWQSASRFVVADREAALADYAGWAPMVQTLIASTEQVSKWVLYDGDPLPAWTRGRVTILGDAAHPMLPFAGQGAGQSIEDAVILARCLQAQPNDVEAALARYFRMRYDRASRVQARGRASAVTTLATNMGEPGVPLPPTLPNDWVLRYDALNVPLEE